MNKIIVACCFSGPFECSACGLSRLPEILLDLSSYEKRGVPMVSRVRPANGEGGHSTECTSILLVHTHATNIKVNTFRHGAESSG